MSCRFGNGRESKREREEDESEQKTDGERRRAPGIGELCEMMRSSRLDRVTLKCKEQLKIPWDGKVGGMEVVVTGFVKWADISRVSLLLLLLSLLLPSRVILSHFISYHIIS